MLSQRSHIIPVDFSFWRTFFFSRKEKGAKRKIKSGKRNHFYRFTSYLYFPNRAMPSLIRASAVSRQRNASSELWAPSAFST